MASSNSFRKDAIKGTDGDQDVVQDSSFLTLRSVPKLGGVCLGLVGCITAYSLNTTGRNSRKFCIHVPF